MDEDVHHRAVTVAVRTRPTATFAADEIRIDPADNSISVHRSAATAVDFVNNKQEDWGFRFHQVLHNASQETTYDTLCRPIVQGVAEGVNGTIMAYGQTGAGKTFTMVGDTRAFRNRGVAPRAIAQIFQDLAARPDMASEVFVSYMEIYNERIYDLLSPTSPSAASAASAAGGAGGAGASWSGLGTAASGVADFQVVEDPVHGTLVRGLTMRKVETEEAALDALFVGELNRTTAEHLLNKNSNRSHCIFTVYVAQRSRLGTRERIVSSRLHLVDLAGSERLKKTLLAEEAERVAPSSALAVARGSLPPALDDTLKRESMYINTSLSYLEQCVVALTSRRRTHIPYRQTKLTNVLKDALGGNCRTVFIACVWAESRHLEETISTLKLAARMMHVQNRVVENVSLDPAELVVKYERQIRELKQELAMHDALADRAGVVYDEYTPEEQERLAHQLRAYVDAETPDAEDAALAITSVRQMRELLRQVKILVKSIERDTEDRVRTQMAAVGGGGAGAGAGAGGVLAAPSSMTAAAGGVGSKAGPGSASASAASSSSSSSSSDGMVGDLDSSAGFSIGLAAPGARPGTVDVARPSRLGAASGMATASMAGKDTMTSVAGRGGSRAVGGDASSSSSSSSSSSRTPERKSPEYGLGGGGGEDVSSDRNEAWRQFRSLPGAGAEMMETVSRLRGEVRVAKQRLAEQAAAVNDAKTRIDSLERAAREKRALSTRGGSRGRSGSSGRFGMTEDGEVIVDEEEFALLQRVAEAKRAYRDLYAQYRAAKEEFGGLARHLDDARDDLVREFERWFSAATGAPLTLETTAHGFGATAFGTTLGLGVGGPASSSSSSTFRSLSPVGAAAGGGFVATRVGGATAPSSASSSSSPLAWGGSASLASGGGLSPVRRLGGSLGFGDDSGGGGGGDALDEGETFERMEAERVAADDPESLAYFQAHKKMVSSMRRSLGTTGAVAGRGRRSGRR